MSGVYDAVIVSGGHNALVAAYLAGAGKRVIVLERLGHLGGAAVSERPWPGVDARLSRYSYLVSLLPPQIIRDLDLQLDLRRRRYSSYTPDPVDATRGLLVDNADAVATTASFLRAAGDAREAERFAAFSDRLLPLAATVFPTMTEPLRRESYMRLDPPVSVWARIVAQRGAPQLGRREIRGSGRCAQGARRLFERLVPGRLLVINGTAVHDGPDGEAGMSSRGA